MHKIQDHITGIYRDSVGPPLRTLRSTMAVPMHALYEPRADTDAEGIGTHETCRCVQSANKGKRKPASHHVDMCQEPLVLKER